MSNPDIPSVRRVGNDGLFTDHCTFDLGRHSLTCFAAATAAAARPYDPIPETSITLKHTPRSIPYSAIPPGEDTVTCVCNAVILRNHQSVKRHSLLCPMYVDTDSMDFVSMMLKDFKQSKETQ